MNKPAVKPKLSARVVYFIRNIPNWPTALAFAVLRRSLRNDPAYYESWKANIAMAIYDQSRPTCQCGWQLPDMHPDPYCPLYQAEMFPNRFSSREVHADQCNQIAERFLTVLLR